MELEPKLESDAESNESVYSELEVEASDDSEVYFDESDDSNVDNDKELSVNEPTTSSNSKAEKVPLLDEYCNDSSDEEDNRNTIGNIPLHWYDDYDHVGYDVDGKPLLKPYGKNENKLNEFLQNLNNPSYWRTVKNKQTGQDVVLTPDQVSSLKRLFQSRLPDKNASLALDEDFFLSDIMQTSLSGRTRTKTSFVPSRWEKLKVGKMVHAIKMGWLKPRKELSEEEREEQEELKRYYALWTKDVTNVPSTISKRLQAPKMTLPGHEESYNPPPEYLFNENELTKWQEAEPSERRLDFIPKSFHALRQVPGYSSFIKERFNRCLDLYLCPRQQKIKMKVNVDDLLPKLPRPKDLHPFPTVQSIVYKGHTEQVRSISISSSGQYLVSGSNDGTVRFWEIFTGRMIKCIDVGESVDSVQWNPQLLSSMVAFSASSNVYVVNSGLGDRIVQLVDDKKILNSDVSDTENQNSQWTIYNSDEAIYHEKKFRIKITHSKEVKKLVWHKGGDYLAVVCPTFDQAPLIIHQFSKRRSQVPFKRFKGVIQCVEFHPNKPFLFVATQRFVRVYNLVKRELVKKLSANCQWISSMDVHPSGDHVIIGSYDCKLNWFDLDLSNKPYQTLKHQKKALRQVTFHRRYPLFASSSDDGTVVICHATVYSDLLQNPTIVPVKILHPKRDPATKKTQFLDCLFHPNQPWIIVSDTNGLIRLFS